MDFYHADAAQNASSLLLTSLGDQGVALRIDALMGKKGNRETHLPQDK